MSRVFVLLRAALVWAVVTALAGLLLRLSADVLVPTLRLLAVGGGARLDRSFDQLLAAAAATALAAATVWGWSVTTAVVAHVLVRRPAAADRHVVGVPRPVQRVLLTACGAALAGGLALPAHAEPGTAGVDPPAASGPVAGVLTGLPLPERATAGTTTPEGSVHVVRPGDSLWAIAASRLPEDATDAEITASWQAVHRANRAVVGPDPDLVHPAQRLRVPGA